MASSSRAGAPLIAALLLAAASARAQGPAAGRGGVRVAAGFRAFLWRAGGPALDQVLARRLRALGFTGVAVDDREDPRVAAELGLPFYLDHAAGKGILHLRAKDFEPLRKAYERTRNPKFLVRPHSLLDPKVRAELFARLRERVTRAARYGPLWVSLEDEISTTRFVDPLDFDYGTGALAALRRWLEARYGSIAALARAWPGPQPRSFADLVPPTTDEVRRREAPFQPWPRNLCDWNDRLVFFEQVLAELVGDLAAAARKLLPGVPVGFEGGQPPAAFGGYDWRLLLARVDAVEAYDLGGTRALVRSLARPGTLRFETLFPAEGTDQRLAAARLYDMLAHGLSGVIVWSAERVFGGSDPEELSPYGRMLARELPRATGRVSARLAGARIYPGSIAILESQASVRLHWMLDSAADGKTWIRRLGSYERTHSTSMAARLAWIRLFQDLGYAFRFVTPAEVASGRFRLAPRPRVLVLPSALALSARTLAGIRRFAARGGLVLADETPGRYDERLVLRPAPPLDAFFGVERRPGRRYVREGRALPGAPRTEDGLALAEAGLAPEGLTQARGSEGGYFAFERIHGEGAAVLLNLAVVEYARDRLREERARPCIALRRLLRRLFSARGVLPVALARVPGYPTVLEKILLGTGPRRVLVVRANVLDSPALFAKLAAKGPARMTVHLPVAAEVRELFSGRLLGRGRKIETRLDPIRGTFLSIEAL